MTTKYIRIHEGSSLREEARRFRPSEYVERGVDRNALLAGGELAVLQERAEVTLKMFTRLIDVLVDAQLVDAVDLVHIVGSGETIYTEDEVEDEI